MTIDKFHFSETHNEPDAIVAVQFDPNDDGDNEEKRATESKKNSGLSCRLTLNRLPSREGSTRIQDLSQVFDANEKQHVQIKNHIPISEPSRLQPLHNFRARQDKISL